MTEAPPAIDKSSWGPGEWQDEPDRKEWVAHGFACLATRHQIFGNWCGYVGVPRGHRAYGKPFRDLDFHVHGGLNYTERCQGLICHVPAPGMPDDVWWLGFDCGHAYDRAPGSEALFRELGVGETVFDRMILRRVYRTLEYAVAECESLAAQLTEEE